jgi:hypothetical protein
MRSEAEAIFQHPNGIGAGAGHIFERLFCVRESVSEESVDLQKLRLADCRHFGIEAL